MKNFNDKIFTEVRNNAIKSAWIPNSIKNKFKIIHDITKGKLIIKNK